MREANGEMHIQALCHAQGMSEREEGLHEAGGSRSCQWNPWKQLTWAHRSSQILDQQLRSLHGTDLGPLHMCDSCIALFTCRIPS